MTITDEIELNRIRKKWEHEGTSTATEVRFLLSLVDSQVAEQRPFGWISCGLRDGNDRIVDIVFENADCAKAFIDNVEPVDGPIVIADSMRSACIEKVKEHFAGLTSKQVELDDLIKVLQSVTIQEQKS